MQELTVYHFSESPENASIGDYAIFRCMMSGFGWVYEVRKLSVCTGQYAKPGDQYWANQTNEPFAKATRAQEYIEDCKAWSKA